MKERSFISSIGIMVYIILTAIDRFVFEIPNYVYIPIAISGIAIILAGSFINRRKKK